MSKLLDAARAAHEWFCWLTEARHQPQTRNAPAIRDELRAAIAEEEAKPDYRARLVALEDEKNTYIDYVGDALGQSDDETLWDAAQRVLSERDNLRAKLAAMEAASGEPVAMMCVPPGEQSAPDYKGYALRALRQIDAGHYALYTHPAPRRLDESDVGIALRDGQSAEEVVAILNARIFGGAE